MAKRGILSCGCRRSSVRKRGHRPACGWYDQTRYNDRVAARDARRKATARDPYFHTARTA